MHPRQFGTTQLHLIKTQLGVRVQVVSDNPYTARVWRAAEAKRTSRIRVQVATLITGFSAMASVIGISVLSIPAHAMLGTVLTVLFLVCGVLVTRLERSQATFDTEVREALEKGNAEFHGS